METFRKFVTGWFGKVLLVIFTIPFAFLGIESYFAQSSSPNASHVVNGDSISKEDVEAQVKSLQQNYLQAVGGDASLLNQEFIQKAAVNNLISRQLLLQQAQKLGISLSTAQIEQMLAQSPELQENGVFSAKKYEEYLRATQQTNEAFVASVRQNQAVQMLVAGLTDTLINKKDVQQIVKLANEQRHLHFASVALANYRQGLTASDAELQSYYDKNKNQFVQLAQAEVEYVVVSLNQLEIAPINVTDEELKQAYQQTMQGQEKAVSFESAKAQLKEQITKHKASTAAVDAINKLNEDVIGSDSLETIQQAVKGTKVETVQLVANTQHPILNQAVVKNRIFSEDSKNGEYRASSSLQLANGDYVWVKVKGYQPAGVQPFEKVKQQVQVQLLNQKAAEKAKAEFEKTLAEFKTRPANEVLAAESRLKFEDAGFVSRGQKLLPKVQNLAFGLPAPKEGQWSVDSLTVGNELIIVGVSEVKHNEMKAEQAKEYQQLYHQYYAQRDLGDYIEYLKSIAQIKDNQAK